jgi:hypothetical protein
MAQAKPFEQFVGECGGLLTTALESPRPELEFVADGALEELVLGVLEDAADTIQQLLGPPADGFAALR